jgi:hypothetical protein
MGERVDLEEWERLFAAASGPCGICTGGYRIGEMVAVYRDGRDQPVVHLPCARASARLAAAKALVAEDPTLDPKGGERG